MEGRRVGRRYRAQPHECEAHRRVHLRLDEFRRRQVSILQHRQRVMRAQVLGIIGYEDTRRSIVADLQ